MNVTLRQWEILRGSRKYLEINNNIHYHYIIQIMIVIYSIIS